VKWTAKNRRAGGSLWLGISVVPVIDVPTPSLLKGFSRGYVGFEVLMVVRSRYSDGLWAGRPEFDSRKGQEIYPFSNASSPALGPTQPPIPWVPGTVSPKRLRRESDGPPPSGAEVKNGGAIPPLPIRLHGVVLN
jgi:hypothetical protein